MRADGPGTPGLPGCINSWLRSMSADRLRCRMADFWASAGGSLWAAVVGGVSVGAFKAAVRHSHANHSTRATCLRMRPSRALQLALCKRQWGSPRGMMADMLRLLTACAAVDELVLAAPSSCCRKVF
jgi:hypothetical protein